MRERIQKVLAARGIGSRRQVEAWIAAGRISVNGRPASPGQAIGGADVVRLDGRRLRLAAVAGGDHEGMAYHRPAQEGVRSSADGSAPSSLERLPRSKAGRWIPVSPLAACDGGLELFLTDGALAAALMRRGHGIPADYSVRVRGDCGEAALARLAVAAGVEATPAGSIDSILAAGGEGSNRWLQVRCTGLRPRDLRAFFERRGYDANRILRTRIGPIAMDRALARGRSRRLTPGELETLAEAAGLAVATTKPARPRRRPTGSRARGR